jgi:hypothetical protein
MGETFSPLKIFCLTFVQTNAYLSCRSIKALDWCAKEVLLTSASRRYIKGFATDVADFLGLQFVKTNQV